jgi:TolB-like protein
LARATALYRGDLLDGLDVRDPAFEEWLLFERQRLRDLARAALAKVLDRHVATGTHDQAGVAARRLLALDPLHESAHRALMRIYAQQGQAALALKQYQLCRDALQDELGVKPEAETERLYQSIREKRAMASRASSQAPPAAIAAEARSPSDAPPLQPDPATATASARPSIAVLPFENLSDDPEQQYFSDGITEDIITALSRVKWFFVIARNSSFTYKGRIVDVKQVARELGVRYVLEGSVRKAGGRVRISGQLVQAETGQHIWADKFDGELANVFDLQDQVTASVVAAIEPSLRQAEIERARGVLHDVGNGVRLHDGRSLRGGGGVHAPRSAGTPHVRPCAALSCRQPCRAWPARRSARDRGAPARVGAELEPVHSAPAGARRSEVHGLLPRRAAQSRASRVMIQITERIASSSSAWSCRPARSERS